MQNYLSKKSSDILGNISFMFVVTTCHQKMMMMMEMMSSSDDDVYIFLRYKLADVPWLIVTSICVV